MYCDEGGNYSRAETICGNTVILFYSDQDEKKLWQVMSDPNVGCDDGQIWIGITDHQREGQFLDVLDHFYEDVFEHGSTVGESLKETNWAKFQPNGGVSQNCITTSSKGNGWNDRSCKKSKCVACSISANQLFVLRGLCRKTR